MDTNKINDQNGGLRSRKVFKEPSEVGSGIQRHPSDDAYYHIPLPTQGRQQAAHQRRPYRDDKQNLKVKTASKGSHDQGPHHRRANWRSRPSEKSTEVGADVLQDAVKACAITLPTEVESEGTNGGESGRQAKPPQNKRKRLCRYFKAGRCYNGDSCQFWHPSPNDEPRIGSHSVQTVRDRETTRKIIVQNPAQVLLEGMSENKQEKLYNSETNQLERRYAKSSRTDGEDGHRIYQFTFVPSDPDWVSAVFTGILVLSEHF